MLHILRLHDIEIVSGDELRYNDVAAINFSIISEEVELEDVAWNCIDRIKGWRKIPKKL